MRTPPKRTRTARARFTRKRSPTARNRYLLIGLGLLVVVFAALELSGFRLGPKDLPTFEDYADELGELNGRIEHLARRRPSGPDAWDADRWLDDFQKVLDRVLQMGLDGAVGDRADWRAYQAALGRTEDAVRQALSGAEWAHIREAALGHLPQFRD